MPGSVAGAAPMARAWTRTLPRAVASAGPAEGAALGNVLVQARALGAAPDGLDGLRALLRSSVRLRRFEPSGDGGEWAAAARRVGLD